MIPLKQREDAYQVKIVDCFSVTASLARVLHNSAEMYNSSQSYMHKDYYR